MTSDETPDRDTLSSMKVSELRQMCSDRGFLVSGKKDELVNRLMGLPDATKSAPEASLTRSPEDIDDAIDRLISRVSGEPRSEEEPESEEPPPKLKRPRGNRGKGAIERQLRQGRDYRKLPWRDRGGRSEN